MAKSPPEAIHENNLVLLRDLGLALDTMNAVQLHVLLAATAETVSAAEKELDLLPALDAHVSMGISSELNSRMTIEEESVVRDFQDAWYAYLKERDQNARRIRGAAGRAVLSELQSGDGNKFHRAPQYNGSPDHAGGDTSCG